MTLSNGEEFSPNPSAGSGGEVIPPPPKIALHNPEALHRELARVYRDMRAGRIATQDGTRLAYVLNQLREFYETLMLKRRVEYLESIMDRGQDND